MPGIEDSGKLGNFPGRASSDGLRVLLVDDHALFRRGLRELLEQHGVEVVGEGSDGNAGVRLACELVPDVVVMDLSMPNLDGVEATRRLTARAPTSRVLMLTVSSAEPDVLEALLAGACGYVLKDAPVEQVITAIRAAADGESFVSPAIAARLVDRLRANEGALATHEQPDAGLTERELEVLRLLARGEDNHQIAAQLFVSAATVKRHVSNILAKLQIENRIQAAVYAARHGLE